jgi:hypothetical protein
MFLKFINIINIHFLFLDLLKFLIIIRRVFFVIILIIIKDLKIIKKFNLLYNL